MITVMNNLFKIQKIRGKILNTLEISLNKAEQDLKTGNFSVKTVKEHINDIKSHNKI